MTLDADGTMTRAGDGVFGAILREIVRGGIAGAVTGAVVAGAGGRVVMRLAALAVPGSAGSATANGNVIGDITPGGTFALIAFGSFVGLLAGAIWVAVAPWVPGAGIRRAIAAMPVALALGGIGLIEGDNVDFRVLDHDTLVVALLVGLVAAVGFVVPLVDDLLDRWLPRAAPASQGRSAVYAVLAGIGGILTLPFVVGSMFDSSPARAAAGLAFLATSSATLWWWKGRIEGIAAPSRPLARLGRWSLAAVALFGLIDLLPEVREALGLA
jgi:hypothetical protein